MRQREEERRRNEKAKDVRVKGYNQQTVQKERMGIEKSKQIGNEFLGGKEMQDDVDAKTKRDRERRDDVE